MLYMTHVLTRLPQIAAPCGPDNYKKLFVGEMDRYLDFWNMMAYDFCELHDQFLTLK